MEYKYYLPDSNNQARECVTKNNSLIIIGGNGTGKSKLGEWMEKNQVISTHRIGAQRSLVFGRYIQQRSYEQAINLLMYANRKKGKIIIHAGSMTERNITIHRHY